MSSKSTLCKWALAPVVALAALAVAAPASASFDHHFVVVTNTIASQATPDGFRFHEQLLQQSNRSNQVGSDRGRCHANAGQDKVRCAVVVHLNGEVGGFGDLYLRGNLGRHDARLNVTGGTGDFEGAAGKVVLGGGHDNRILVALTD